MILERVLKIRAREASFATRGFEPGDPDVTRKLEAMLESFIGGYNLALKTVDADDLAHRLRRKFDDHHVGFAFEGVGLYLALLDLMIPGESNHLARFVNGPGKDHDYIIAVGAGFAIARVPFGLERLERYSKTLDPLVAWCIAGGLGFHEGFFRHKRFIERTHRPPKLLSPIAKRLFDSGLGRALWWVECADGRRIASAITNFEESRRPELWAGVGIAAAYAGAIREAELRTLQALSGPYQMDFLSGLPFAARLRQKGQNHSPVTDMACRVLLGLSTDDTADLAEKAADAVRAQVEGKGITNAYDLVRRFLVAECRAFTGVSK